MSTSRISFWPKQKGGLIVTKPTVVLAICVTLVLQAIGFYLIVSNLNIGNANTAWENQLANIGAILFLFTPLVMIAFLVLLRFVQKRTSKGQSTKSGVNSSAVLSGRSILFAIGVVAGAWALLFGANYANEQFHDWADERASQASQERTRQHEADIREQREEKWARTCVTARNISTDLQTFDEFGAYQDRKAVLQREGNADELEAANELVDQINQLFKDCESDVVTPTEQRRQILELLDRFVAI